MTLGLGKEENHHNATVLWWIFFGGGGARITKEDIEKPNLGQKPFFGKIVRLLEDLGFCNVKDVHDGSRI